MFPDRAYVAAAVHRGPNAMTRSWIASRSKPGNGGLPLLATNQVHYHDPLRRPLHEVLTAVRHHTTVAESGNAAASQRRAASESAGADGGQLFARYPDAIRRTVEAAERCYIFTRSSCATNIPKSLCPERQNAGRISGGIDVGRRPRPLSSRHSRQGERTARARVDPDRGAALRGVFPDRVGSRRLRPCTRHSLPGARLGGQFRGLLLPGHHLRRSRAKRSALRTLHQQGTQRGARHRRRFRARTPRGGASSTSTRSTAATGPGIVAEVITYRPRSAVRDVGKALGSVAGCGRSACQGDRLARRTPAVIAQRIREAGLAPNAPSVRHLVELSAELIGFPRHLSQHVGGFVITGRPLSEMVPDRKRRDAGPHRHRMGQGRSRRARHPQGRLLEPGDADRDPQMFRFDRRPALHS